MSRRVLYPSVTTFNNRLGGDKLTATFTVTFCYCRHAIGHRHGYDKTPNFVVLEFSEASWSKPSSGEAVFVVAASRPTILG